MLTKDTYFIDRHKAYKIAVQTTENIIAEKQQFIPICYHDGEPFPDPPSNLISVPINTLIKYFSENPLRIPACIDTDIPEITQEAKDNLKQDFTFIIQHVQDLQIIKKHTQYSKDTYFLYQDYALDEARLKNRVRLNHPNIDGLQICYYSGDPITEKHENLIHVSTDGMLDYFTETKLRLPKRLILPPDITPQIQQDISKTFDEIIKEAYKKRIELSKEFLSACKELKPIFDTNTPLRIFLATSRMTEVMQYCSKNLANAFNALGHDAFLSIEQNEMESLSGAWTLKEYHDHNPHLTININHINNNFLHPDVFNVTWWQDPMRELVSGNKLSWRERDIVMSVYPFLDKHLKEVGASNILRQHFCIDEHIFKLYPEVTRDKKIIFIGSSYRNHLRALPEAQRNLVFDYQKQFADGNLVSFQELEDMIQNFSQAMHTRNFIVRDTAVRWICEQSKIPVEIYGRGWDYDPVISQHFKGELPHGKDVAKAYNSASHSLVCIPEFINSQRLFEISACGCIPIVYDSREEAEKPHWEDECLFFKTKNQLFQCLLDSPIKNPITIASQFTYENMAKSIIKTINTTLGTHY